MKYFLIALFLTTMVFSCGRSQTEHLLLNKQWNVYDVTPPKGTYNVENSQQAKEYKNGFYKGAWFKFLPDSVFIASFEGQVDTGKYAIRSGGKAVSLYPRHGNAIYEQIEIKELSEDHLQFNTKVADFRMTLHLKADE